MEQKHSRKKPGKKEEHNLMSEFEKIHSFKAQSREIQDITLKLIDSLYQSGIQDFVNYEDQPAGNNLRHFLLSNEVRPIRLISRGRELVLKDKAEIQSLRKILRFFMLSHARLVNADLNLLSAKELSREDLEEGLIAASTNDFLKPSVKTAVSLLVSHWGNLKYKGFDYLPAMKTKVLAVLKDSNLPESAYSSAVKYYFQKLEDSLESSKGKPEPADLFPFITGLGKDIVIVKDKLKRKS